MAITAASIGAAAAVEAGRVLGDTFDAVRAGEASYIKDGSPESITGQIGQAMARATCRRYGGGIDGLSAKQSTQLERQCRPYLDEIGQGSGPSIGKPFEGGQCEDVYEFVIKSEGNTSPFSNVFGNRFTRGPITGWRTAEEGSRTIGYVTSRSAPGNSCNSTPALGPLQERVWFNVAAAANRNPFSAEVLGKCSPGSDNCGNPPPVVRPPTFAPDPFPRPEPFNPGPDIDIDIDVEINPDGSIDIDIGTGPITIEPFPEGGDDDGGGGGGDTDPPDPGSPGDGGDTGGGGDVAGEAGEGEELVGVLVEVLSAPPKAGKLQRNVAEPFRGVGYVRMGYPGRLGNDVSGSAVISPQFFHAQQRGLTSWEVRANLGFDLRATPYYRASGETE